MRQQDLRVQLEGYYTERRLRPEAVERLTAMVTADADAVSGSERAAARSVAWMYGLAACVALLLVSNVYFARQAHLARYELEALRGDGTPAVATEIPRFVAVRTFAEKCAKCPLVAPVFDKLIDEFSGEGVAFITVDLSNEQTVKRARALTSCMGIEWCCSKSQTSGEINLVDRRHGEVLATLSNADEMPQMRGAIRKALFENEP